MAEAIFTAADEPLQHNKDEEIGKIEENGFDIAFVIAGIVIFCTKNLEELLRYILAAVASDNIEYLDFIGKAFNENKEQSVWDGNKAYEGFKTLLQPSDSSTGKIYSGLWQKTDFRKILEAAVQQLGPRYRLIKNHDRQSAGDDRFLRTLSLSGINSTDEAVKLMQIISVHDSVASRILRRNIVFELIRPLNLTLGCLIYESLSNPWNVGDSHGQSKRKEDSAHDVDSRKAVKQFVERGVANDSERTAIKADLMAINGRRNDLIHYSEKNKLTLDEREQLTNIYSSIVSRPLFAWIFKEEESKGKKHKFRRMKSFQDVPKPTEWKAHYLMKMEKANALTKEIHELTEQQEVIKGKLREANVTIERLEGEAYSSEQIREAAMSEKEECEKVIVKLEAKIRTLQKRLSCVTDEVNRLKSHIKEIECENQEMLKRVGTLQEQLSFEKSQNQKLLKKVKQGDDATGMELNPFLFSSDKYYRDSEAAHPTKHFIKDLGHLLSYHRGQLDDPYWVQRKCPPGYGRNSLANGY